MDELPTYPEFHKNHISLNTLTLCDCGGNSKCLCKIKTNKKQDESLLDYLERMNKLERQKLILHYNERKELGLEYDSDGDVDLTGEKEKKTDSEMDKLFELSYSKFKKMNENKDDNSDSDNVSIVSHYSCASSTCYESESNLL